MSDSHQTITKKESNPTIQRTEAENGLEVMEQHTPSVDGTVLQRTAAPPASLNPNQVLQLQRMVGNQAVGQLLGKSQPTVQRKPMSWESAPPAKSGPLVQPSREPKFARFLQRMEEQGIRSQELGVGSREQDSQVQAMPLIQRDGLRVGPANDKYEKEADETADQIMRMPSISSQMTDVSHQTTDEGLQRAQVVQRAGDGDGFEVGSDFSSQLSSSGSGRPLPKAIQADFGSKMGADLSGVRVHTGSQSADMNSQIQAKAFTHGGDIHFGSGQYQPNTVQGKRLIAHEVTHTVQQGASPVQSKRDETASPEQDSPDVSRMSDLTIQRLSTRSNVETTAGAPSWVAKKKESMYVKILNLLDAYHENASLKILSDLKVLIDAWLAKHGATGKKTPDAKETALRNLRGEVMEQMGGHAETAFDSLIRQGHRGQAFTTVKAIDRYLDGSGLSIVGAPIPEGSEIKYRGHEPRLGTYCVLVEYMPANGYMWEDAYLSVTDFFAAVDLPYVREATQQELEEENRRFAMF